MAEDGKDPSDPKDPGSGNTGTLPEGAVSASDAQTLRDSHEAELRSVNEKLTNANEDGAKALAAKEAAEAKVGEATTQSEELAKAKVDLEAANVAITEANTKNTQLVEAALIQRREFLKTTYKLEDDKVKDLDGAQLDALQAVLPGVAASRLNAGNLDLNPSGSGGNGTPVGNARERIRSGLASSS